MPDDVASLTKRLDRIEQVLERLSAGGFGGPAVDPPPEDLVRLRPDIFELRLIDLIRHIVIKGDPPPRDLGRFRGAVVLGDLRRRIVVDPAPDDVGHRWVADPVPEDLLNTKFVDLVQRWRGGTVDPPPEDLANLRLRDLLQQLPGGGVIADPAPDDLARFSRQEIEAHLLRVRNETNRLQSLGQLLEERLGQIGEG